MITSRILRHQRLWSSGGRYWLLCPSGACASLRSPVPSEWKSPWLGSLNGVYNYTTIMMPSYLANKLSALDSPYDMKICRFSAQALVDSPVDGIIDVPLAQTGEGIAECELLKWFVREGDEVEEFQQLCEVQSDKATIEITSRYKGTISQLLHSPGNIVKVGESLLKMNVGELRVPMQSGVNLEKTISVNSEIGSTNSQNEGIQRTNSGGVLSTPAVRILAKQYGIDVNDVNGSGKDGRVVKDDVLKYAVDKGILKEALASSNIFAEQEGQHVSAAHGLEYGDEAVVLRGYQRAMVKSMTLAAKVPHFHYVEEINCDALVELKASLQNANSDPDVKYTFLPIMIKSLSMALSKFPFVNSYFNEESQNVTIRGSHNIGIAMATQHGLVVPNIKKVQSLSIFEITKELSRLQKLASSNKLSSEDISGGTITLSNIGAIGGKFGSPLVNVPEVAIIAIGRMQKIPHFTEDGDVYPMSAMTVNVGADHRVLDGATVAGFCNEWKRLLENPELLMLHMR